MAPSASDFEGQDALFEKDAAKGVPPELARATMRMEFPPSYVVVGAYRLLSDRKLLKPAWDKCRHAARRGAIAGGIWAFLTFGIQRKFIEVFLRNSPRITGLSHETIFGYRVPFNVHTYAAVLFVGSQVTNIMRFFLRKNLAIVRDRAWAYTVESRGKGPEFWQPYVEEWDHPPRPDVDQTIFDRILASYFGRTVIKQAFGFAAALLEGLPIIGLVFMVSNRVGAAMWAHDLEKRQHYAAKEQLKRPERKE
ncbi:hypothetical protein NP233_g1870 [Leucocoprinus birnbaumii]|uniref:Uncharacterized protein n=1 Tax=Leucocoprinus birnbaumii TaxID=56174 RepID=A0AAD5W2C4_9AGAR|nr:hypothetical protein NP233_g1870 [Leucocoprinus birnbaumii]